MPSRNGSVRWGRVALLLGSIAIVTLHQNVASAQPIPAAGTPTEPATTWRSPALFGLGIGFAGVGLVGAILGPMILDETTNHEVELHIHGGPQVPLGVSLLVGGVLFMGGGVTLMVFGAGEDSEQVANVAIGPGTAHLRVQF